MAVKYDIGSDNLHSEWEQALGHPLTPTEFEELKENLLAFFTLLHDWQVEDQLVATAADGRQDTQVQEPVGGDAR